MADSLCHPIARDQPTDADGIDFATPSFQMMELLALLAVFILTAVGWAVARLLLGQRLNPEEGLYFAPICGIIVCAAVAYVSAWVQQTWLIPLGGIGGLLLFVSIARQFPGPQTLGTEGWLFVRFSLAALLLVYAMQLSLHGLFSRAYHGPDDVWNIYNATGVSPPDQMFAWHQATFVDLHRQYGRDPFYGDIDLYDRPHLGGYLTLFFFKLFHLPLTEAVGTYPADALRFYHALWWLLNDLYLLGVALLFRRLFGVRGAIFAVAVTAGSAFFLTCNLGVWVKFISSYPVLLALALFLEGRAPLLQAALCVVSFYLHGSVFPFVFGFGMLHVLAWLYPLRERVLPLRDVICFGSAAALAIGAWFIAVRWVGSKQPLFYYYFYQARLTQAQTEPVAEIAKAFYAKYSWAGMSLLPLRNLARNLIPPPFLGFYMARFHLKLGGGLSELASLCFVAQRVALVCAIGVTGAPLVLAGFFASLRAKHAGKFALCLYLIPTLLMALTYRKEGVFSLHIMLLYHTLALFLWTSIVDQLSNRQAFLCLAASALEGAFCALFADHRAVRVQGIRLRELSGSAWLYLGAFGLSVLALLLATRWTMSRFPAGSQPHLLAPLISWSKSDGIVILRKAGGGMLIVAAVMAIYAVYCRRFY